MENSLEKGKSMPVGTITNGFKKIAEGKWRKVSSEGKTKEEHKEEWKKSDRIAQEAYFNRNDTKYHKHNDEANKHFKEASKLDSKEYSDVDVVGKEKEEDYSKLKISDLQNKVTGYLNMPEYKKWSSAKNYVDNFGEVTHYNKAGYDNAERERVEALKTYKKALMDKIKDNPSKVDKSTINDIEKALVTLEIGYLAGQVSDEQIKEARKARKNG